TIEQCRHRYLRTEVSGRPPTVEVWERREDIPKHWAEERSLDKSLMDGDWNGSMTIDKDTSLTFG
ncbi:hypothetical protein MP638_005445, partial [Amoeboaphelidium occidentale]